MSKALPWVRFFPSDWLAGTRGLSPRTTALYITAIALMYEKDGPIKPDLDWLSRYCSMGKKQTADALAALIEKGKLKVLDDGRVSNERAEREIEIRNKASDSQRKRSESGWAKKRSKTNGPAMPGQSPSDAQQMPTRVQSQSHIKKVETPVGVSVEKAAVAAYSTVAGRLGLPKIRDVSKQRRRKLHAILQSYGLDRWQEALTKIESSAFCRGENDRGWRASFDFLVQPSSFLKLLEGHYDNRPQRPNGPSPPGGGNWREQEEQQQQRDLDFLSQKAAAAGKR